MNTELIVEYENGEEHKEQPENIIFADSKAYVFLRAEAENESVEKPFRELSVLFCKNGSWMVCKRGGIEEQRI
mgnify:CR=1 FL=1